MVEFEALGMGFGDWEMEKWHWEWECHKIIVGKWDFKKYALGNWV